jgi:GT2 family glycosyltransferase
MENMVTTSIVTYKTDIEDLKKVVSCMASSIVETIYVIDNSPLDELKVIADYSDKIIYIFNNANLGYGTAHNIAIRKSIEKHAKYHIIINPDIYFEKGVVETLTRFMDDNEDIGHVMPKIIYPNGELQYLCKLLPTPLDLIFRRFFAFTSWAKEREGKYELRAMNYNQVQLGIPFLSGCFMLLRTAALEKIAGFDERYFLYMEDADLCRRAQQISKAAFYPAVSVVHNYAKGSYKNHQLLLHHIWSAVKYFNKWGWVFDKGRETANEQALKAFAAVKLKTAEKSGEVKNVEKSVERILYLLRMNPHITQRELIKHTGLSNRSMERNIKILKTRGLLEKINPDKDGYLEGKSLKLAEVKQGNQYQCLTPSA